MEQAQVILFKYSSDLDWPKAWPRDIGVGVYFINSQVGEIGFFHEEEDVASIGRRLRSRFSWRGSSVSVHAYDLEKNAHRELSRVCGLFVLTKSDVLEQAHDFALNYDFARSEGVDLSTFSEASQNSELRSTANATLSVGTPANYITLADAREKFDLFSGSSIEVDAIESVVRLTLPGYEGSVVVEEEDLFVHERGVSFAIDVYGLMGNGGCPGTIFLPLDAVPFCSGANSRCPVLVVEDDGFLKVSPKQSGDISGTEDASHDKDKSKSEKPSGNRSRYRFVTPLLLVGATLGALFLYGAYSADVGIAAPVAKDPDSLKEMLFQK